MATPPRRPTYYFGTEALFPSDGAQPAPGKARGTPTPGADAILNDARPHGPRLPPPIQGAVDYVKDGIQGGFDRMKGDMIGAGTDLATKFQPLDNLVSTFQRAGWSASSPASTQPASRPAMSDNYRRLAQILGIGEGNYESYNTGTKGVPGGGVGHSYINRLPGTVTGKTINQILATDSLSGTDRNRMNTTGAYQIKIGTLELAKRKLKLTGEERFTPELQDRIFTDFLISKAGGGRLAAFINKGQGTVDDAQYAAAKEWASVAVPAGYATRHKGVSDGTMSYYGGPANSANVRATQALRTFLTDLSHQPRR